MKKIFRKFFLWILLLNASIIIGFLANCFISNHFKFELNFDLLLDGKTYLYGFFIFGVIFCLFIWNWYKHYWTRNTQKLINGKESDKHVLANLEQAHFQTEDEINSNFKTVDYDEISHIKIDGIPVRAEQIKNKLRINFSKPSHTLIIGTTGSGKTTTFISPTIQILSQGKNKPSLLISDPKGELFSLHSEALKKRGYEVKVLDLRNPYNSVKWNPLERPFLQYQKMIHLDELVIQNEEEGYWEFDGVKYYVEEEKNVALQVEKQKIYDEVYEDLHDIVSVICPVINKNEPMWESGSKNFILAIALAMLEDSQNPELGMTVEKFNFYNIMKIATNTENDCNELERYFKGRGKISQCVSLSKQLIDASDKTRGSYLSNLFDKLSMFADMSLCSLTSKNEMNFAEMAERPIALFLQIPDEKETRHTLASMVILQAYKELVAKANTYADLSLPRSVYFLLDEFGNLPKVHKLEQMITVGRSRKIWLCLVIQSYAQLAKVYDDKSADIIKANCNTQIFIGTTDLKTIEDFSKLCGNYSIIQRGVSFSTGNNNDPNASISVRERPLIYPTELQQLNSPGNMGNAIVNIFGFSPIKSKFTPSYQCSKYDLGNAIQVLEKGRYFDEKKVFYDMVARNDLIVPKPIKPVQRKGLTLQNLCKNIEGDESKIKFFLNNLSEDVLSSDEKTKISTIIDKRDYEQAIAVISSLSRRTVRLKDKELIRQFDGLKDLLTKLKQQEMENDDIKREMARKDI